MELTDDTIFKKYKYYYKEGGFGYSEDELLENFRKSPKELVGYIINIVDEFMEYIDRVSEENVKEWKKLTQALGLEFSHDELLELSKKFLDIDGNYNIEGQNCNIHIISYDWNDVNETKFIVFKIGDKQALIKLDIKVAFPIFVKATTQLRGFEILLPLEERNIDVNNTPNNNLRTFNSKTNWYGVYNLSTQSFTVPERYDNVNVECLGIGVEKGKKHGFIGYYPIYNIPRRYDELQVVIPYDEFHVVNLNLITFDTIRLVLVRNRCLWGAYCYMPDIHRHYNVTYDRTDEEPYIKKVYISPMFEKIEVAKIDKKNKLFILKPTLNGKVGLLDVYKKKMIAPIIFDEINSFSYTSDGEIKCYGVTDGIEYLYDGTSLYKSVPFEFESYKKTRKMIENKGIL